MAISRPVPRLLRSSSAYQGLDPVEQEKSLFQKIGDPVISGIAKVANVLDLPGSSVRDLLAGENPIDQWFTPTQHKNRAFGRDILANWGVMNRNKEGGFGDWWDDPMEAVRDTTGFLFDVATDPLSYTPAGFVTGAMKGAGKGAAKVAGKVLPKVITRPTSKVASSLAEKSRLLGNQLFNADVKGVGKYTPIQEAAKKLSEKQRVNQADVYGQYLPMLTRLDEAGMLTKDKAEMIRDLIENARKPALDRHGNILREPPTKIFQQEGPAGPGWVDLPGDVVYEPVQQGAIPDLINEIVGTTKADALSNKDAIEALSGRVKELDDPLIDYSTRRSGPEITEAMRGNPNNPIGEKRPLGTGDPGDVSRALDLKGFYGGSNAVNRVLSDPQIGQIIKNARGPGSAVKDVADYLGTQYAHEIRPLFKVGDEADFVVKDRFEELAKRAVDYWPEFEKYGGMFTNHPIVDAMTGSLSQRNQADAMEGMFDLMANPSLHAGARDFTLGKTQGGQTIGDVVDTMGNLGKSHSYEQIANRMNIGNIPTEADIANAANATMKAQLQKARDDALSFVRDIKLKEGVYDEITKLWPTWKMPDETGPLKDFWKSFTSLFKMGVLAPWPARYVRDMTSGAVRNFNANLINPSPAGMAAYKDAQALIRGGSVGGLTELKPIQDWLKRTNRPINDDTASQALREIYASQKGTKVFANTDLPGFEPAMGQAEDYLEMIPGQVSAKEKWQKTPTSANPLKTRGVVSGGKPRQQSEFALAKAGEIAGEFADDINRVAPLVYQMRQGVDPAEAMKKIMDAQVRYSPDDFTKFEKGLKQVIPFYSFAKGNLKWVANELSQNPGGRLGKMMRAQNTATGTPDPFSPDYIQANAAIPLSEGEDGSKRYLGPLGLMHDDALNLIGGDSRGMLEELGSRSHPLIKGPVEWMTGQSLFRRDMPLDELDPSLGRIATNFGLQEPTASGRAAPILGSPMLEHSLANSPLARAITTARTLTDDRKGALGRILNTATGARVTDVPAYQQEGILRDKANEIAKRDLGARTYARPYIPKELIAEAEMTDPQLAESMVAYNQLQTLLNNKAKKRKKAEEKK